MNMKSKKHIENAIKNIGMTLAKYVETLQRSNEQLVKLCSLMSKQESSDELSDKDFAQIFDQIQKSEEEDEISD